MIEPAHLVEHDARASPSRLAHLPRKHEATLLGSSVPSRGHLEAGPRASLARTCRADRLRWSRWHV